MSEHSSIYTDKTSLAFKQELRALIDRYIPPSSGIANYFRVGQALEDERERLDLETDKFPEDAEAKEGIV
jgi:hypothetical protein